MMIKSLPKSLFSIAVVLFNNDVLAFAPNFRWTQNPSTLIASRMMSSSSTSHEEALKTNPANCFGQPISDDLKKFNKGTTCALKELLFDTVFKDRDIPRFYALETIARVPYFSYLAVLHFYETIGLWRKSNYLKIHFAESWNEAHHLMIMEELGGADRWMDRFIAQHIAVVYFWLATFVYLINPVIAYNLNEAVEEHAFLTYDKYIKENEAWLKSQPAPSLAKEYYESGDLYMFDEFQTGTCNPRRPSISNLYDVFCCIREDEKQHMITMGHLQTDTELTTSHDEECTVPDNLFFVSSTN